MLAIVNNRTFKKRESDYFSELFIGSTVNKCLKQYQIELDTNSLLGKY